MPDVRVSLETVAATDAHRFKQKAALWCLSIRFADVMGDEFAVFASISSHDEAWVCWARAVLIVSKVSFSSVASFFMGSGSARLWLSQDGNQAVQNFVQLVVQNVSGTVTDNSLIGRKQPVGPNPAALVQSASREVGGVERHRIDVGSSLARDLTQNHVGALQRREH